MILFLGIGLFVYLKTPLVEARENILIEVNSNIKASSLIKNIKLGSYENTTLDTSKVGKKEIKIKTKSFLNKKGTKTVSYKVVDTNAPLLEVEAQINVQQEENNNLLDYIFVKDNSKEEIEPKITGDYDLKKEGKYKLKISAKDSSGNETVKDVVLNVIAPKKVESNTNNNTSSNTSKENNQKENNTINTPKKTKKGYDIIEKDGVTYINGILIANKTYALPKNYGQGLTSETSAAFTKMQTAAKEAGLNIFIKSGFRSYQLQTEVYNNWVKLNGQARADTYSARPGHSEHQSGLAMDVNLIEQEFANTEEFKWLQKNAYKYGFILRYPKEKESITGYIYEPWHYRYVEVSLAEELYNNGNWITLEEYLGIDSKYK